MLWGGHAEARLPNASSCLTLLDVVCTSSIQVVAVVEPLRKPSDCAELTCSSGLMKG